MPRRTYDSNKGRTRPFTGAADWKWLEEYLHWQHAQRHGSTTTPPDPAAINGRPRRKPPTR